MTKARQDFNHCALFLVDVEAAYADPKTGMGTPQTAKIAKRIGKLAESFRKAGIKVIALEFSRQGFFGYAPKKDYDIVVQKYGHSGAVEADDVLKKHNITKIYAAGFNLSVCVKKTLLGLASTCDVNLMKDLAADGLSHDPPDSKRTLKEMQNAGIEVIRSADVRRIIAPKKSPKK